MRVGIIAVFVDHNRNGKLHHGVLQPQVGPLIAGSLPGDVEVEIINETWREPDWTRDYDLLFISCLHADFDRARQLSHYWRRRGARTVFGGTLASTYPELCRPFFDAVVVGDAEGIVPTIYRDFCRGELQPVYVAPPYDAASLPTPRFDLAATQQVLPISLEATRGCPFSCEFCALTAIGTRHHVRPVERVIHDIREGQRQIRGLAPAYKRAIVAFVDNNIGGNLRYLSQLCDALTPVRVRWGSAITFNCISDPEIVKAMSRSGCRFLFVGLESFNPASLADMRKFQNVVDEMRRAIDLCRKWGILVLSGLLLNPAVDDWEYVQSIPRRLDECGLHVPTFVCFQSPIPGTPQFLRAAAQPTPALLPNALLRDFTGYTLVEQPRHVSAAEFVEYYKWVVSAAFHPRKRLRKLVEDVPRLIEGGFWDTAGVDVVHQVGYRGANPRRTYLAGNDIAPPEMSRVPFEPGDFSSEEERRAVMDPWPVTDAEGRVLPEWQRPISVFERKGQVSAQARQLVAIAQ